MSFENSFDIVLVNDLLDISLREAEHIVDTFTLGIPKMTDKTKIYTQVTNDISISVIPAYEAADSNPAIGKFIYSYQVTIENLGHDTVKLLTRHWHIVDSIQIKREISGEGVIGQQPELHPGEMFQYMSWCPLNSPIGKMFEPTRLST